MKWIGPMLHLLYPPKHDPVARELAAMLERGRESGAEIAATRARLERAAQDRGTAIDDAAGERG